MYIYDVTRELNGVGLAQLGRAPSTACESAPPEYSVDLDAFHYMVRAAWSQPARVTCDAHRPPSQSSTATASHVMRLRNESRSRLVGSSAGKLGASS